MTPLLRVTLALALGSAVGMRFPFAISTLCLLLGLAVSLLWWRRDAAVVASLFGVLGASIGSVQARQLAQDCRALLQDSAQVQLIGVPTALPVAGQPVTVRARTLRFSGGMCRDVEVRVHVHGGASALLRDAVSGDSSGVALSGRWVKYPRRSGWPRAAGMSGAVLADTVVRRDDVHADVRTRFRARRQAALRAAAPERWPLAEALLLAQRSGLTAEMRSTWVAAGLVHLLAISGMHVGLIAAGILLLGRFVGLPRRRAHRVALAITAAYVLFLGAPHAALRALLQAALLLGSVELQRPAEPFTLLAAAAFVILLLDPLAVADPGFQLSFAGMIGLLAWRRALMELLPTRLPQYVREGLAAGIAASALTTPIAALHFGQAAWIGIIASLVASPVLGAAIAMLVVALLCDIVFGAVPHVISIVVEAPLHLLELVAQTAAALPGGHFYVAPLTVLSALGALMLVIVVRRMLSERVTSPPPSHAPARLHVHYALRARRGLLALSVAGAAGLVAFNWTPTLIRARGEQLEIHAIDVGQGDAFAVRTPRGRWFLIDAGPRSPRADAGRERVVPYLQRRGVRRLEAVILTHPDADHIGGAAAVLESFDVGIVVDPGMPAGKDMYIDLLTAARSERVRWIAARAGIVFRNDGVTFEFLYPLRALDALRDANDNSVVFRLGFGSFGALFTGDAPAAVEEALVARHGSSMRVSVLKVGHHGSTTSTSEALLEVARPTLALVSAGRRNRYGHPAPSVLRRLARHEVRVLRTDELGHVMVRAHRDGRIEAHRQQ